MIEEQEAGRSVRRDLAAQLEADAAAGTGDEDDPALDHHGDGRVIQLRRCASEDVLDGDRADVRSADAPAGELRHRRNHEHAEAAGGGERADLADAADARGREREDDLRHAILFGELTHAGRRTDDGDAVDVQVMLGDVVVEETDRLQAVATPAEEVGDKLRPSLARADDSNTLDHAGGGGRTDGEALAQGAHRDAEADEQDQGEVEVDQRNATRQTKGVARGAAAHEHRQGERGEGRGGEGERHAQGIG